MQRLERPTRCALFSLTVCVLCSRLLALALRPLVVQGSDDLREPGLREPSGGGKRCLEYGPRHKDAGDRAGDSKTRNMHRGRSTLVAVALALALLLDGCDAKKGQGKSKKSKTP